MKLSALVLTEFGGIQEEVAGLGKPVLVLRNAIERSENGDAGTVRLIGTETAQVVQASRNLLDNDNAYNKMAQAINPYGYGNAAKRIVIKLLVQKYIK